MPVLQSYGKEIHSVFQLLGEKENDMTFSMSWALARCPAFLMAVVEHITGLIIDPEAAIISNQQYESNCGITDIEITDNESYHIIIEAKRGWILPESGQLTKYSVRPSFIDNTSTKKFIVALSECTQDYALTNLPFEKVHGIPISHISWQEVYSFAEKSRAGSNHEQKHLLLELLEYLKGVMTMQNLESNMVYVVALSPKKPEGCDLSWIDVVVKHNKYFCPVGGKEYPKEPPNYIAFRYYGKLQSIHHIESYMVSHNLHDEIPEMPDEATDMNYYVYRLGPAIKPMKTVKTGRIFRNGRVWAMLDTLLTCDSISGARDLTQERLK